MNSVDEPQSVPIPTDDTAAKPAEPASVATPPLKTPMFQATYAERYGRQARIREIQKLAGRKLICYVAGLEALISREDVLGLVDLLYNVPQDADLDFLIHTSGGDIDAAEKLVKLVRAKVGTGKLRVIVPDFAKSAGTLIALAGDSVLMSDTSELGAVDPQVVLDDGKGNKFPHSVLRYLQAYESHSATLATDSANVVAKIMLNKLEPATVKLFEGYRDRARTLAEQHLNRWMFQSKAGNYTEIASKLMDISRWPSHGQMIGHSDAKEIGLNIDYVDSMCPLWREIWHLYCVQRLAVGDKQKLFESDYASLPFDS